MRNIHFVIRGTDLYRDFFALGIYYDDDLNGNTYFDFNCHFKASPVRGRDIHGGR